MKKKKNTLLKNDLCNLSINQPIIHAKHGIGRYKGLTTIEIAGTKSEYLIISYVNNDKLYVPVTSLHLINKYYNINENKIPLHRLGGKSWKKERQKISKKIFDNASILLNIYANRASQLGFSFKKYEKKYLQFCKDFSFKTTPDQSKVINSVLNDMYSSKPMDRLVCGDVGFGKTEVAMRAAFIASCNKKQVVILVPTTLLAQQHYKNFLERFSKYSISIEVFSSFQKKNTHQSILKNIKKGKINILIGTHKILFNQIKWHDLGLLIIDEEHRFGVSHKEHIKQKFNNIDILTLTATPIPRTLNMSLLGIRDLSIINTPPDKKLLIKTFIKKKNKKIIKRAILKEINRGGQVYYVYNKVQHIERKLKYLSKLIPKGNFRIGHGKMKKQELKKIIHDFSHNRFNILLCTTIIENGLDIPLANTIIIENADHFGLSQLHQLRGRVGRSSQQAYAWLLVSNVKKISKNSKKRLQSICSIQDFSSGFILANHDLEIRGVGEILGNKQSGYIKNIGIEVYMNLLKKAVKILKTGNKKSIQDLLNQDTEIKLQIPAILPESYIPHVNKRLSFYFQISSARTIQELKLIKLNLIKNFGKLPKLAKNLISITKIKIISKKCQIKTIKYNILGGIIKFICPKKINIKWLIKFLKKNSKYWFLKKDILHFNKKFKKDSKKIKWIVKFLLKLKKNQL
ncbi:transcription-repair coupling factor [Buchnera aphidicola]|uniref:transcription-repair coupling factor n=1 Tax=Buchnera aphidicola TaxID=9 RepID=UPI0020930238|nr:transcription-repair coupling factor [Buchnera aphidicola]USS94322.1 transcription-repair coupling factor [Buchnera aphidicola (Sipha maydis)]WII23481.1 transcription-repair coupling factor [Buchnera aphidicola (Sipha maydis)]